MTNEIQAKTIIQLTAPKTALSSPLLSIRRMTHDEATAERAPGNAEAEEHIRELFLVEKKSREHWDSERKQYGEILPELEESYRQRIRYLQIFTNHSTKM